MLTDKFIMVGMSDLNCIRNPGALTTLALGSCVGIALYDNTIKVAGLAHCMLPDSRLIQNNLNTAKFVDTAILKLIEDMRKLGARKEMMKAKIAGGAQMFAFNSTNDSMRIGDRNVEAALKVLAQAGIPVLSRDVGATYGRTVELYAETGRFLIKTIEHGSKEI